MKPPTTPPPRVSVVVPAYNSARFIEAALRGVLAQTFTDWELIVIDDGSTDATPAIVQGFGDRLRYAHQDNQGVSAARNHGLMLARGEWIAFLDSDDLWAPEKLERQLALADRKPNAGLIYCKNRFIDEQGREIADHPRQVPALRGDAVIDLFCDFFLITSAVIVRRDIVERSGRFDETLPVGEDYDFFLRALMQTQLELVDEPLLLRRVHAASLSRRDFVLDGLTDLATLKRFLREYPHLMDRAPDRMRARMAQAHFDLAWRCLETGRNALAARQLVGALQYERSGRIFKNLALCALPLALRRRLKAGNGD